MSLKMTPGLGKSGMSRMCARKSISSPSLRSSTARVGAGAPAARQKEERIVRVVVLAHFEVQVRPARAPRAADGCDQLPLANALALLDVMALVVCVYRGVAALMAEDYHVAIAGQAGAIGHLAVRRGAHPH